MEQSIEKLHFTFMNYLKQNGESGSSWSYAHGYCMIYAYAFSLILDKTKIPYKLCNFFCKSKNNGHVFFKIKLDRNHVYFDSENTSTMVSNWRKLSPSYKHVPTHYKVLKRESMIKKWGYDKNPELIKIKQLTELFITNYI